MFNWKIKFYRFLWLGPKYSGLWRSAECLRCFQGLWGRPEGGLCRQHLWRWVPVLSGVPLKHSQAGHHTPHRQVSSSGGHSYDLGSTIFTSNCLELKISQLHELLHVRHSVFIVGMAGTGKTVAWKTLLKTYQNQKLKPICKIWIPRQRAMTTSTAWWTPPPGSGGTACSAPSWGTSPTSRGTARGGLFLMATSTQW